MAQCHLEAGATPQQLRAIRRALKARFNNILVVISRGTMSDREIESRFQRLR
jgi:hypothetical protein